MALFHLRGRLLHRRTRVGIGDHSFLWADLNVVSTIWSVIGNPPDWNEMQAWRRILRPGDLFVDVGASAGNYTILATDRGAEVVAVEPDPVARQLLTDNLALNPGAEVEVIPGALSTKAGTMTFSTGRGTMNSLVLDAAPGREVQVQTLDDVLGSRHARGVKVDVEGAERLVLDGATRALSEGRIDVFQLEWNVLSQSLLHEDRSPVVELLTAAGYRFYRPDLNGRLEPSEVDDFGRDVFAVRGLPADVAID